MKIHNMTCASCVKKVKSSLAVLPFVGEVDVNLVTALAKVGFTADQQADFERKVAEAVAVVQAQFSTDLLASAFSDPLARRVLAFAAAQAPSAEAVAALERSLAASPFVKRFDLSALATLARAAGAKPDAVVRDCWVEFQPSLGNARSPRPRPKPERPDEHNQASAHNEDLENSPETSKENEPTNTRSQGQQEVVRALSQHLPGLTLLEERAARDDSAPLAVLAVDCGKREPEAVRRALLEAIPALQHASVRGPELLLSFDSAQITTLALLRAAQAVVPDLCPAGADEHVRAVADMQAKLAVQGRAQLVLALSSAPLLAYMVTVSFDHRAAAPLLFAVEGLLLPLWALTALVAFNWAVYGAVFHAGALRALRAGSLTMDFLISLSTSSALAQGVWRLALLQAGALALDLHSAGHVLHQLEAANSIVWLVLFGKWLEKRATVHCHVMLLRNLAHSQAQVRRLKDPAAAHLVRAGALGSADWEAVDSQLLSPGDCFLLTRNEEVPLDAVFRAGARAEIEVSEHLITGESKPVAKHADEQVYQGSVHLSEPAVFEVLRDQHSSTFMQIKAIVQDARELKTSYTKWADLVVAWMVAAVLALAVLTAAAFLALQAAGLLHHPDMPAFALECVMSMVVVCCPCSIGLTSALVSVQTLARLNARGVILRKDSLVEDASRLGAVVFDKTGTLVSNALSVAELKHDFNLACLGGARGQKAEEVMLDKPAVAEVLFALAKDLNHPISVALANAFRCASGAAVLAREYLEGQGLKGSFSFRGRTYAFRLGKLEFVGLDPDMLAELGGATPLDQGGDTAFSYVFFRFDDAVFGYAALENHVKPEARAVVDYFRARGVAVHMFTGDNAACARRVAAQLAIDSFQAGMLPAAKRAAVAALAARQRVLFVGDGVNDAQALAAATVGVALDTKNVLTCASADVVVLGADLRALVVLLELARAAFRIIRQNYFWALVYNLAAIPLAGGWFYFWLGIRLAPSWSAMAMMLSCFCIIVNSFRISS